MHIAGPCVTIDSMSKPGAVVPVIVVLASQLGCVGTAIESDGGVKAGSAGTIATSGSAGKGGSGGTGGISSTGGSSGCKNMCNIDFPCGYFGNDVPKCLRNSPNSITSHYGVSCQEACGTPCCTGGGCATKVVGCSAGTVCAYPTATATADSTYLKAECVPTSQTCGGEQDTRCPAGQYCEQFGILCWESGGCPSAQTACDYVQSGGLGTCRPLPSSEVCGAMTDPVCGCDGVTYANDCARMAKSTVWAHAGACSPSSTDGGGDTNNIKDMANSSDQSVDANTDLDAPKIHSDSAEDTGHDAGTRDVPLSPT
jgi:hypothetical protein